MVTVGSERLAAYLKNGRITLAAFAERVGTSKSLVHMWRSGARTPGLEFALKIQKKARIPTKAWLEPAGQ